MSTLSGSPDPEVPVYQAHICRTHLDPLADVLGVEGCACESCEKARRTKEVDNFRAQSLANYEQEFAASRRPDDDPFEGKFYGDTEGPAF